MQLSLSDILKGSGSSFFHTFSSVFTGNSTMNSQHGSSSGRGLLEPNQDFEKINYKPKNSLVGLN